MSKPADFITDRNDPAFSVRICKHYLVVDVEQGDLDCLCWSLAEQRVPIFKLLPGSYDPYVLATKGAALWSLRLNSRTHEQVSAVCSQAADVPGGAARRLLRLPVDPNAAPFKL
jgi:hypothetical protein